MTLDITTNYYESESNANWIAAVATCHTRY